MNIGKAFKRTVRRFPDRPAVVDPTAGVRYTYGDWYRRVETVAAALQRAGIRENDRVGAVMRNRVELATIYCATQLAGATFVPFNFRSSPEELSYLIDNATPALLFVSESSRETVDDIRDDVMAPHHFVCVGCDQPGNMLTYETFLQGDESDFEPRLTDDRETSLILHTGGTTGRPKGVPRSHENTHSAAMAHAVQCSWEQGEATLGHMPLFHTMGIHALAATILLSGKWVAQRSFSAEQTVSLIEREELTSLYLVPTVYHDLVHSGVIDDADLSSVRSIVYAGASMQPNDLERTDELFEPDTFVNHYGSTEVYTHAVCSWVEEKPGCTGRAGINTQIRIVEPGRRDPTGTVEPEMFGEIIVDATSPEAFDSYLSDDAHGALREGWFFTGDLGYKDIDGDLFVTGRVDNMINSAGENIYPIEVENVLDRHDAVEESAVVGRPSDRLNQVVTAFVTTFGDTDEVDFNAVATTLDEYCMRSDELADYKRPRKYYFIDEITKSNVGKILRKELQKDDPDIHVYEAVSV